MITDADIPPTLTSQLQRDGWLQAAQSRVASLRMAPVVKPVEQIKREAVEHANQNYSKFARTNPMQPPT